MSKRNIRIGIWLLFLLIGITSILIPTKSFANQNNVGVHIIPIEGTINSGNATFIEHAITRAVNEGATTIIFEVNTLGGFLDQAIDIKDLILHTPVPTITFVNTRAISAGALISLAGEQLVMATGATIGAAEPQLIGGERADEKTMSMWVAQLVGVAEVRGRDGEVAAAMADSNVKIPGLSYHGELLTLTELQAYELGIADEVVVSMSELLSVYDLDNVVVTHERTMQDRFFGLLTNPIVSTLLLILGIAGIIIEAFTAGSFGVFGVVGILGFALFFTGNFMEGNMGAGTIFLFIAGLLLLALEIFVIPGFGVVGVGGIIAILASIIFAAPSVQYGILILFAALVVSTGIIILTLKNKKTRKVWGKLANSYTEEGYSSDEGRFYKYEGKKGKSVTILRPAGTAIVEGDRIDVVTGGEFIDAGKDIEVVLVEGARIVVREVES